MDLDHRAPTGVSGLKLSDQARGVDPDFNLTLERIAPRWFAGRMRMLRRAHYSCSHGAMSLMRGPDDASEIRAALEARETVLERQARPPISS